MANAMKLVEAYVELQAKGLEQLMGNLRKLLDPIEEVKQKTVEWGRIWADFFRAAQGGFAALTASVTGFVHAASPAHFATLSGSISLVGAAIGTAFLPWVEKAIDFLQDLYFTIQEMDPKTKQNIANWVMWGAIILGAVVIIPRLLGFLGMINALFAPLNAGLRGAMSGFSGLGGSIRGAASAMGAWLAANPATAVLAIVGVVLALAQAFGTLGQHIEQAGQRMEELDALAERLREGPARGRDIRQAGVPEALRQQLLDATGDPARQRAILEREQARLRGELAREAPTNEARALEEERATRGIQQPRNFLGGFMTVAQAGVGQLSEEQLRRSGDPIREVLSGLRAQQAAVNNMIQNGVPADLGGRRRMISSAGFQSQIGNIESAWRRLQQSAASMGTLEEEMRRVQSQNVQRLADDVNAIRARLDQGGSVGGVIGGVLANVAAAAGRNI